MHAAINANLVKRGEKALSEDVLDDMMNILLKYLPGDILPKERIEISYDIMELSDDLNRHSLIEERILIPCVESLENALP